MTNQDNKDPNFHTEIPGEQKSHVGCVIGAIALFAVALTIIFFLPSQILNKSSINTDQSKPPAAPVSNGSGTGPAPGTNPSAPVNRQ